MEEDWSLVLIELGAIFLGLAALSWLAGKWSISPIPFYLAAGLAFGEGGLLPVYATESFVATGGEIGLVLLLLVLGLEFSAPEFLAGLRRHRTSGIVDFSLNFTPGFVAGLALGLPWQGSLAMGGVTWISSSGIISQLLEDLGRVANRETGSVMSVLVLEDIAMAVFLPVLVVLLTGESLLEGAGKIILAIAVLAAAILIALRAGGKVQWLLSHENDDQVLLRILGVAFLVAGISQEVGISSAVGAFLVGLSIPPDLGERARELLLPMRTVFASVFFFAFGLAVDPTKLGSAWVPAILLALVTIATKTATGWYAAGRDGVRARGRVRAGLALVARGEFSIVIAGLAASAGVTGIGAMATAYVLIMAVAGPLLARHADTFSRWFKVERLEHVAERPST